MKEIAYSTARQNLKTVLDEVVDTKQPVRIIRRDHAETVVVLGESLYRELAAHTKERGKLDG